MSTLGRALLEQLDADDLRELRTMLDGLGDGAAILTTAGAARHAGVSVKTVRRGIDAGYLDAEMVAGRWQTTPEEVDDWRARGCPTTATPRVRAHGMPRRNGHPTSGAAAAIREAGRLD